MMRSAGSGTSRVAVQALAILLCLGGLASGQKTAKKMVPDNPSPHPAPEQPIPYSHKQHLAFSLPCAQCHTTIAKDKPAIQKLATYASSKEPIPWVRVYKVLPGIAWTHRAHLAAGVKCETCHGAVAEMATMSEVTSVTTMYGCLNCHEINHAKASCDTCHKH